MGARRAMNLPKLAGWAVAIAMAVAACTSAPPVTVSDAEFGDAWPFHVETATLYCEGPDAIWAEIAGQYYALNPIAPVWVAERHPDIALSNLATVWRDDPNNPGTKSDLGPVMDRALAICHG